MNLKWFCVTLGLIISINALAESEIDAFIGLTELGYEDACSKAADAEWKFIKQSNNETRQAWESALSEYAQYKRTQKKEIAALRNETFENTALEYKSNLITKPGDALLEVEHWQQFVSFVSEAESSIVGNITTSDKRWRQRAESLLSKSGPADEKLKTWKSWDTSLDSLTTKFSQNLQRIETAAKENGLASVDEYWAALSDYEKGYEEIEEKWNEIISLHKRIVRFVQSRLMQKYPNEIKGEELPIHLLGSLQGYDWTPLALDVVPHPNLIFEIQKSLWEKGLLGGNLYKSASRLGNIILKHVPEAPFWEESDFDESCPSRLVNFCKGNMKISTCSDESSIGNYLSAHKDVGRILVNQMATEQSPILNLANRYSAIDAGVEELFGVLSISRAWLLSLNLVKESDDLDEVRVVSLMITALDVLPRMAYYLAADMWRLDAIKHKIFDPKELSATWWKFRFQYEGITTISNSTPTFLYDDYIINNKPYLSKFLGILLGFQIYEYLMESTEMRYDKIESIALKHELIKVIQYGSNDNWYEVVKKYLEFYDVLPDSLLSYFTQLEQYLDEIEDKLDRPIPLDLENKLEDLEQEYKRKIKNPPTTKKVLITTTTTTAPKFNATDITTVPKHSKNDSIGSQMVDKQENSEYKSQSIQVKSVKWQEENTPVNIKPVGENKDEKIVTKSETNKAVWAVGAVLVAAVTIVIIAIFGRRRCRKTPKNRRYV